MTLYETYAALIRRGMPKHERLQWPGMDEPHWWSTSHGLLCGAVNEADARDLITMHAQRWFVKLKDRYVSVNVTEATAGQAYCGINEYGTTILDSILAATEHLEPEKQE